MKADLGDTLVSPKVHSIVSALSEKIRSGHFKEGQWFPTERELVEEFGVSRTVIRKAMDTLEERNLILRSPRCRAVVQSPPASNGAVASEFSPLETARLTLGLWIWPNPNDPAVYALTRGIYEALDHSAFRLVVGNAYGNTWSEILQSEERYLECIARDKDVEGIILWYLGDQKNRPALEALREASIPLVFIDRRP